MNKQEKKAAKEAAVKKAIQTPPTPQSSTGVAEAAQTAGIRSLVAHIEATYDLIRRGHFEGADAPKLIQVMAWLENYHKTMIALVPKEPAKLEVK